MAWTFNIIMITLTTYNIVDLQDRTNCFRGQSKGTDGDQQRLCYSLIEHVGDSTLNFKSNAIEE